MLNRKWRKLVISLTLVMCILGSLLTSTTSALQVAEGTNPLTEVYLSNETFAASVNAQVKTEYIGTNNAVDTFTIKQNEDIKYHSQSPALPIIIEEDTSRRGEYEKHFLCDDGSYIAVSYPKPVHMEQFGEWVDADLPLTVDGNRIMSVEKDLAVSLAKTTDISGDNGVVSISTDNYELSWSIEANYGTNKETAHSKTNGIDAVVETSAGSRAQSDEKMTVADLLEYKSSVLDQISVLEAESLSVEEAEFVDRLNKTIESANRSKIQEVSLKCAMVAYPGALGDGTTLRYYLSPGAVKEEVVLESRNGFVSYTTTLDVKGLTVELREDNSILLLGEMGEPEASISAPFMYDATHELSCDFDVGAEQVEGIVVITYTPDAEWLDAPERVWPVIIDPTVDTKGISNAFQVDNYVYQGQSSIVPNNSNALAVGWYSGNEYRSYWKIGTTLPTIPSGNTITGATYNLRLSLTQNTLYGGSVTLHRVTGNWSSSTITWNYQPTINATSIASTSTLLSANWLKFTDANLTSTVKNWYNGSYTNEGLRITASPNNTTRLWFYSADETTQANSIPYLVITYAANPSYSIAVSIAAGSANTNRAEFYTTGAATVQSTNLTSGSDPALYDSSGARIADDEAGAPHFRYTTVSGTHYYAGTYANGAAGYTITSTAPITLVRNGSTTYYTVTYNRQYNGSTEPNNTVSVAQGAAVDLTPTATKSGWTFVGWNTSSSATTGLSSLTMGSSNITLYAIFSKTVTGTFIDYNGTTKTTRTVSTTIYNNATSGTITTPAENTYTGWTARGWSTSTAANASVTVSSGGSYTISANVTLYGLYHRTFPTLSYNVYGGSPTPANQIGTQYTNSYSISTLTPTSFTFTLPAAPAVSRTGHTLSKWALNSLSGTQYNPGTSITIDSSITMYALWTPNSYTVRFNANGGAGAMTDQSFVYGSAQNLTANAFTPVDSFLEPRYIFEGWATSPSGIVAYTDKQAVFNLASSNGAVVNLYAVWAPLYPARTVTMKIWVDDIYIAYCSTNSLNWSSEASAIASKAVYPFIKRYNLTISYSTPTQMTAPTTNVDDRLEYLKNNSDTNYALNTLFYFDANAEIEGLADRPGRQSVISCRTSIGPPRPHSTNANQAWWLTIRRVQHEWSHNYGANHNGDLDSGGGVDCTSDCIMNSGMDTHLNAEPNIWCSRCEYAMGAHLDSY